MNSLFNSTFQFRCGALLFISTILAWNLSPAYGSDWMQFRGPKGQGKALNASLPLKWSDASGVVWKIKPPGSGTSSPIVVGDRVFMTGFSGFNVPSEPEQGSMKDLKLWVFFCLYLKKKVRCMKRNLPIRTNFCFVTFPKQVTSFFSFILFQKLFVEIIIKRKGKNKTKT